MSPVMTGDGKRTPSGQKGSTMTEVNEFSEFYDPGEVNCVVCNGAGEIDDDDDLAPMPPMRCDHCNGTGIVDLSTD